MTQIPNAAASTEDFEFAALNEAKNYRQALIEEFLPFLKGEVIEIGAGIGQMTRELLQLQNISRLLPIEPDAAFCKQHRVNHPGCPVLEGIIDNLEGDSAWDAIFSVNVLEHIETDERELASYARLLQKRGGALCLFVPACNEIYASIDHDFGHFRRYDKEGLRSKLINAGLEVVRLDYFNFVGYFAWLLNFRLLKKRKFEISKVRFYDRAIFPIVHALESKLMRPPFGQSLIAVARPAVKSSKAESDFPL